MQNAPPPSLNRMVSKNQKKKQRRNKRLEKKRVTGPTAQRVHYEAPAWALTSGGSPVAPVRSRRVFESAVEAILDGKPLEDFNEAEKETIQRIDEVDTLLKTRGWTLDPDSDFELLIWLFPTADLPVDDSRATGIILSPKVDIQQVEGLMALYTGDLGALRCEVEFPVPYVEGEPGRYSDYHSGFEIMLDAVRLAIEKIEAFKFGQDPSSLKISEI